MTFGHPRLLLALAAFAGLASLSAPALGQSSEPPTGRLFCTVSGGLGPVVTAQKPMECRFRPRRGPLQHYTGVVRSFGLDLASVRSAAMGWRVYGPYARAPLGVLAGQYKATGATPGTAGNTLVGGDNNAVTLQPLPFQGNRGINVAVGVTSFELTLVAPGKRR